MIVSFPGTERATSAEVGGKGYSLMRMAEAGLPVPPGDVLTTAFFAPWFEEIQAVPAWRALTEAAQEQWPVLCNELKALCSGLRLTVTQQQALERVRHNRTAPGDAVTFAVRSSSPEEDLASASFAGGYETRLGVRPADLEAAVRHCFASSLDARILTYKSEHGFDPLSPRIAVVVQRQIDSEVAGVGFSLNPLTNDYDEAVIDANWGLGESVVAGLASPDHFLVDKVHRKILEKKRGAKQVSIWLGRDGGTIERKNHRTEEISLSDAQVLELTAVMARIERLYTRPMDIEWAFAGDQLHLLQARPITAYVPLPPEMVTRPGERRLLYTDIALSTGMTINAPISPMGLAWKEERILSLVDTFVGEVGPPLAFEDGLWFFAGSRVYQNLSNVMWLASPKRLAKSSAGSDALMAEILANVDVAQYRAAKRPSWARIRMLRFAPRMLWRLRRFLGNTLWALVAPQRAHRKYERRVAAYEEALTKHLDYSLPLDTFRRTHTTYDTRYLFDVTMPALGAGLAALGIVDRLFGKKSAEIVSDVEKLKRGFNDNVVAAMGIAMYLLARQLQRSDFEDLQKLSERVESRQMPPEFLTAWDAFLAKYGWRGPLEMDLASPRYSDTPELALRQISFMAVDDPDFDPSVAHARLVNERRQAYEALLKRSGWLRRLVLRRVYCIIDLFAGARDTPKHHNLLFYQALRKRVLIEGRRLVREGRLDVAEDIFGLTFHDIEAAAADSSLDLRQIREERMGFFKTLKSQVTSFPPLIDSRGRIVRPPRRKETPGQLCGMAVSPGIVSGPVKVLRDPYEKPVNKGDVLVAHTTDPGWTPLFVNAAAVVLEVGGLLQHGAVVAREYGKPCVVGIDQLMTRLQDGQEVEVDGATGVIRLLS